MDEPRYTKNPSFLRSAKNPVYFIAEIGGNHEGSFERALKQLSLAIDAGVDAVKFQFVRARTLVSCRENKKRYEHFKKFELKKKEFKEMAQICKEKDVAFLVSIWDKKSIPWINPLVPFHKVGSGDLTAFPIIRELLKTGKPILLSTGLSTIQEIQRTIDFIGDYNSEYILKRKIALLQCTSSYPTPDEDVNLLAIRTLNKKFDMPVGYSDHTLGSEAAYIAVLLGAQALELHFTDTREGRKFRDQKISITKDELIFLMDRIRRAKVLLGSAEKKVTDSEKKSGHITTFRRSVYARKDIPAGQKLSVEHLEVLRPEHGVPAWKFSEILGKTLKRNRQKYDPIREEDIE